MPGTIGLLRLFEMKDVPHQELNRAQVYTGFQQMGGEARTKAVNTTAFFEPCSFFRRAEDVPSFCSTQGTVLGSIRKKPERRPVAFPVLTQFHEQVLRQDGIAVFPAFTPFHKKRHAGRIDVCDFKIDQLADSEPCRIGGHQ